MKVSLTHAWDLPRSAAEQLQRELRQRVDSSNAADEVHTVAGIDVGVRGNVSRAAIVVLSYPGLDTLATSVAELPATYPYIPGLLSFRETPAILAAAEYLRLEPDLIIVDGQGIAHPRRFGIAAHLGVIFNRPTIGCAKSRLIGDHAAVGPNPGDYTRLFDDGEVIGAALRTKARCKPLYISIGNRIDLPQAMRYVLATCRTYRLPEPVRRAHLTASGSSTELAAATGL